MGTMTVSAPSPKLTPQQSEASKRLRGLWFALRRLARVLDRRAEAILQEQLGITVPMFLTLATTGDCGSINQTELADRIGITKGTVSRQIVAAEEAGLLTALTSPHSRREKVIALTPRGQTAYRDGCVLLAPVVDQLGVTHQEFEDTLRMLEALDEVYDTAGAAGNEPTGVPRLWFLVRKVVSLIDRGGEALFREHMGINMTRFLVLSAIETRPEIGPRDLADRLGLHTASISRQLDAATRSDLITAEHVRDPERPHRLTVALTEKGRALLARGEDVIDVAQPAILVRLRADDLLAARTVINVLAKRALHLEQISEARDRTPAAAPDH